jgi:hypothetical protein
MATAKKKKSWKTGARSKHITNLKQSILEALDIYQRGQGKYLGCLSASKVVLHYGVNRSKLGPFLNIENIFM